ncbi:hypothetical protein GN316_15315 [Xylophilus sp. Kf1]|nr:hypothetical protein [Xylophilus sp. Kf1]
MFDPNLYLSRAYVEPPCWQLVADVYATERGQGVTEYRTVTSSVREIAQAFRIALHKNADGFGQITAPQDLCVVLLGTHPRLGMRHCGIYWQGSVLHAVSGAGVLFQDMASIRDAFSLMEFWARPDGGDAA